MKMKEIIGGIMAALFVSAVAAGYAEGAEKAEGRLPDGVYQCTSVLIVKDADKPATDDNVINVAGKAQARILAISDNVTWETNAGQISLFHQLDMKGVAAYASSDGGTLLMSERFQQSGLDGYRIGVQNMKLNIRIEYFCK